MNTLKTVFSARVVGFLLGLSLALPLAQPAQAQTDGPQPKLPMIQIQAGMHLIRAEVAGDGSTRAKGLMFREKLGTNEGMLFVFERKGQHCFWMRNTPLPLSIAFIEDDGNISNIEDMQPKSDDSHCPLKGVRFALEMEKGWFEKKGLKAGSKLVAKGLFGQ